MWSRVFGTNDAEPDPQGFTDILRSYRTEALVRTEKDAQGWFKATVTAPDGTPLLQTDRYLVEEEGIRSELNSWAAWLETQDGANQERLMLHMIRTSQLFVLGQADNVRSSETDGMAVALCRFLARKTEGVYQVDGMGFFDRDGSCLMEEKSRISPENG